ncbi:MAG: DUF364 domain-containing protein [Deltaproteobacteria bacterium]|jgi:uncharacterized protein (DUF4213/DUF364 family)|nr:DUF364 domain-containing protein [Deltaproteobacteria bacterium]
MLLTPEDKWALYDRLIDLVPPDAQIGRIEGGRFWLMVTAAGGGTGLAQRPGGGPLPADFSGYSLRELAGLIKSWDFNLAAVGLAAVNAAINTNLGVSNSGPPLDAFDYFFNEAKGQKVTVVGHFPYLNRLRAESQLTVLERNPQPGDLPDSAAEYVLPESDFVFLTGTTVINKTLPRLLELSEKAKITLVGPSTPLSPVLFEYGVSALAGLTALDSPELIDAIKADRCEQVFKKGARKVNLLKPKTFT